MNVNSVMQRCVGVIVGEALKMLGIVNHLSVLPCLRTWVYVLIFSMCVCVCVHTSIHAGKRPPDAAGVSERRARG